MKLIELERIAEKVNKAMSGEFSDRRFEASKYFLDLIDNPRLSSFINMPIIQREDKVFVIRCRNIGIKDNNELQIYEAYNKELFVYDSNVGQFVEPEIL